MITATANTKITKVTKSTKGKTTKNSWFSSCPYFVNFAHLVIFVIAVVVRRHA
jgi:hypothetical protein